MQIAEKCFYLFPTPLCIQMQQSSSSITNVQHLNSQKSSWTPDFHRQHMQKFIIRYGTFMQRHLPYVNNSWYKTVHATHSWLIFLFYCLSQLLRYSRIKTKQKIKNSKCYYEQLKWKRKLEAHTMTFWTDWYCVLIMSHSSNNRPWQINW